MDFPPVRGAFAPQAAVQPQPPPQPRLRWPAPRQGEPVEGGMTASPSQLAIVKKNEQRLHDWCVAVRNALSAPHDQPQKGDAEEKISEWLGANGSCKQEVLEEAMRILQYELAQSLKDSSRAKAYLAIIDAIRTHIRSRWKSTCNSERTLEQLMAFGRIRDHFTNIIANLLDDMINFLPGSIGSMQLSEILLSWKGDQVIPEFMREYILKSLPQMSSGYENSENDETVGAAEEGSDRSAKHSCASMVYFTRESRMVGAKRKWTLQQNDPLQDHEKRRRRRKREGLAKPSPPPSPAPDRAGWGIAGWEWLDCKSSTEKAIRGSAQEGAGPTEKDKEVAQLESHAAAAAAGGDGRIIPDESPLHIRKPEAYLQEKPSQLLSPTAAQPAEWKQRSQLWRGAGIVVGDRRPEVLRHLLSQGKTEDGREEPSPIKDPADPSLPKLEERAQESGSVRLLAKERQLLQSEHAVAPPPPPPPPPPPLPILLLQQMQSSQPCTVSPLIRRGDESDRFQASVDFVHAPGKTSSAGSKPLMDVDADHSDKHSCGEVEEPTGAHGADEQTTAAHGVDDQPTAAPCADEQPTVAHGSDEQPTVAHGADEQPTVARGTESKYAGQSKTSPDRALNVHGDAGNPIENAPASMFAPAVDGNGTKATSRLFSQAVKHLTGGKRKQRWER